MSSSITGANVIVKTKNGQYRFNLKAGNGEIIATSQVYSTKATAKKGIASIIKNADVPVEDQTVKGFKALPNPKFEVYKDKKGEIRFRLKSSNGQIIATSEGYKDMAGAMNGVKSVKKNAADAKIVDEKTKECEVGLGNNSEFYASIGMEELDVEECYNGSWYIEGYAPQKPEPTYAEKRLAEYPSYGEQLDMIYWDKVNGTSLWQDKIAEIKNKYPKA